MPTKKPQAAATKEDPYAGVSREEKKFVGALLSKIDAAKVRNKTFNEKTLPRLRKAAAGTIGSTNDESTARTNLIYATMATLLPLIYAKNPEIGVTLTEAVGKAEYDKWRKFSKTVQALLNRVFVQETGLKSRSKSNVRSAMQTSVGWLKMIWQESQVMDPILKNRVNDLQDNMRKVQVLLEGASDKARAKHEEKLEELKQAIKGIEESDEIKVFRGLALDRVKTEDMFILDHRVDEFHDYVNAEQLAHRIWFTDEQWEREFSFKVPNGTTEYRQPVDGGQNGNGEPPADGKECYRAAYEVWDRTTNRIYTVAEGCKRYLREPYSPDKAPERWYAFYALGFNLIEGRWRPLSDVELLEQLQKEYAETRHLYAEARKEAIPVWVFRKGGNLTEEDIEKLVNRKSRQWLGIEGNPQVPLNQDVIQFEGIKIDPANYDVSIIRSDMDMMVGLSDASRANLVEAKTATEAEIMRQALQNRVAERQDANEDLITEMANAALQQMLQRYSLADVRSIVGQDAVWPMTKEEFEAFKAQAAGNTELMKQAEEMLPPMPIEDIFNRLGVSVRAGSTGKPNLAKERENWAQLMTVINETVTQVAELRMNGQFDLAQAKVELLRETLRRYDEKLDVDQFIPPLEEDENGQPIAQANALAEAAQLKEQAVAMQEQLQQLQQELQTCQQQLAETQMALKAAQESTEVQLAQAQAQAETERTKALQIESDERVKAVEAASKAAAEAQAKADIEQAKLDAEDRRHEREMERDRYKILVDTAAKLVSEMAAAERAEATAAAKASAEGGEGGEGKKAEMPQMDAAGFMQKVDEMMMRLEGIAEAMSSGRSITITTPDGRTIKGQTAPMKG